MVRDVLNGANCIFNCLSDCCSDVSSIYQSDYIDPCLEVICFLLVCHTSKYNVFEEELHNFTVYLRH
jgi:hypothetical protein